MSEKTSQKGEGLAITTGGLINSNPQSLIIPLNMRKRKGEKRFFNIKRKWLFASVWLDEVSVEYKVFFFDSSLDFIKRLT
jgi:hypothetical protein